MGGCFFFGVLGFGGEFFERFGGVLGERGTRFLGEKWGRVAQIGEKILGRLRFWAKNADFGGWNGHLVKWENGRKWDLSPCW